MSTFLREIKSALLKLNNIHGIHKGRDKLLAIFQWIRNGFEIKFIYRLLCEGRLNESCYMVNAQNAFWYITCHSSLILCNSLAVSGRKTQVPNFPHVGYWCLHTQNQPFGFDWITCWHNWSSQNGPTEPHHIKRCERSVGVRIWHADLTSECSAVWDYSHTISSYGQFVLYFLPHHKYKAVNMA